MPHILYFFSRVRLRLIRSCDPNPSFLSEIINMSTLKEETSEDTRPQVQDNFEPWT